MTLDTIHSMVQEALGKLPPGLSTIKSDLEAVVKQVIMDRLAAHELVTQEAFDAQKKVLLRTRERCDALAKRVNEIESKLGLDEGPSDKA